jgi:hypothetical protein
MKIALSWTLASLLFASCVTFAQAQTPTPATPGKGSGLTEEQKRKAKECSAKADARSLHFEKRREFRAECMKG